jgi:putative phosphoesterase
VVVVLIVGVMSDSHDSIECVRRASRVFSEAGVSAVLHLGDIVAPFTLRFLAESLRVRFEAVFGNNDGERVGLLRVAQAYGVNLGDQPRVVVFNGRRLLLTHGFGDPNTTYEVVSALAESKRWDAVLYGHTHEASIDYRRSVLLLNPGDCSGYLGKSSVALLDLKTMKARLVEL